MPPPENTNQESAVTEDDPLDVEQDISIMSRTIMAGLGVPNEMMQSVNTNLLLQMQDAEIRREEERIVALARQGAQDTVASRFSASQDSIADRFRDLIEQAHELEAESLPPTTTPNEVREAIIREYLEGSRVAQSLGELGRYPAPNPLRPNIDYNSAGRLPFFVDALLPDYSSDPPALAPVGITPMGIKPTWPEWCQVGTVVYDGPNPFKVAMVEEKKVELWSIEDTSPLRMIIKCSSPKELEKYSTQRPRSRWERLLDD